MDIFYAIAVTTPRIFYGKTNEIKETLKGIDKAELGKGVGLTLEVIGNLETEKGEVTRRL